MSCIARERSIFQIIQYGLKYNALLVTVRSLSCSTKDNIIMAINTRHCCYYFSSLHIYWILVFQRHILCRKMVYINDGTILSYTKILFQCELKCEIAGLSCRERRFRDLSYFFSFDKSKGDAHPAGFGICRCDEICNGRSWNVGGWNSCSDHPSSSAGHTGRASRNESNAVSPRLD